MATRRLCCAAVSAVLLVATAGAFTPPAAAPQRHRQQHRDHQQHQQASDAAPGRWGVRLAPTMMAMAYVVLTAEWSAAVRMGVPVLVLPYPPTHGSSQHS